MDIIYLIIGIIIGGTAFFFIAKFRYQSTKGISEQEYANLSEQLNNAKNELGRTDERAKLLSLEKESLSEELKSLRDRSNALISELSKSSADNTHLTERLEEQKKELETIQEKFVKEFENLANKIFEDKSQSFTKQNRDNIDQILNPLKERISSFEEMIQRGHTAETEQRTTLSEQIRNLTEMNRKVTEEANNLTKALKGESKTQGNWGEFILETVLENSGLEKGREYEIQESHTTEEGRRLRPDVIIYLPEKRNIVIDSKVSLKAYEAFCSSDTDEERANHIKEHITSVRQHITGLSLKKYQNLYKLESLDFVLMFMPIESAFALALANDYDLYNFAFESGIVIVSPTTLLATLRTIANIWKQEKQNKYAMEIAKQTGDLYDKFVAFANDLLSVGKKMDEAKRDYSSAMNKLTEGKGNIIGRIEKIKQLGVKAEKEIPQILLDQAEASEDREKL